MNVCCVYVWYGWQHTVILEIKDKISDKLIATDDQPIIFEQIFSVYHSKSNNAKLNLSKSLFEIIINYKCILIKGLTSKSIFGERGW